MPWNTLYGLLADNTAAIDEEQHEQDRPQSCPIDGTRLQYAISDELGETAVCPLGNFSWP